MEDLPGVVRLRAQHGALTRHAILSAARILFAADGYARTSVRALASQAGVSPQTIYDVYGSKAGIVAALPDLLDQEAGITELFERREHLTDPAELLGLLARMCRQLRERCDDLVNVLRSGAAVEPEIAAARAEGLRRRRLGVEAILEQVHAEGGLALNLTVTRAADIAVALMTDEVCDSLVGDAHWPLADYERWLNASLVTQLLS